MVKSQNPTGVLYDKGVGHTVNCSGAKHLNHPSGMQYMHLECFTSVFGKQAPQPCNENLLALRLGLLFVVCVTSRPTLNCPVTV